MSVPAIMGALLMAIVLALLLIIVAGVLGNRAPLFDPPGPGARLALYLRTNIAETGAGAVLPELAPMLLVGDTVSASQAIAQAGVELGWQELAVDETGAQIRAVVTSPIFGFRDDIAVRLLPHGSGRTEAAVRSSSRVGRGDLGANARHIMELRDALRRRGMLIEDGS